MQIRILGSCSGTEPMPGRHQTSVTLEAGGHVYFFDAGENCHFNAYLNGVDLLSMKAIFISHYHSDHLAGLPLLMWLPRKLMAVNKIADFPGKEIGLYFPSKGLYEAMMCFLNAMEPGVTNRLPYKNYIINEGCFYDDGTISVEAIHNRHLPPNADGSWTSFSFLIRCEGKRIVYSGDIADLSELDCFLKTEPCDLFLMETGHHHPWEVARRLREGNYDIKQLAFMHHGRDFLLRLEESKRLTQEAYQAPFIVTSDNQVITP